MTRYPEIVTTSPQDLDVQQKINIKGPSTLTLSENTMIAVLHGLSELPYKVAVPALSEIEAQLITQMETSATGSATTTDKDNV